MAERDGPWCEMGVFPSYEYEQYIGLPHNASEEGAITWLRPPLVSNTVPVDVSYKPNTCSFQSMSHGSAP